MEKEKVAALLKSFRQARIGMLGDFILDIYLYGRPTRISREAPVLIVEEEAISLNPGGGANTLANLLSLGAEVDALGLSGYDAEARQLARLFRRQRRLRLRLLPVLPRTVTKTRIMAGDRHTVKQQVIRIDRRAFPREGGGWEKRVRSWIRAADRKVQGWVVSDYGYGLLSPAVVEELRRIARTKVVVVDSRFDLGRYQGITAVTPNEAEFIAAVGREWQDEREFSRLLAAYRKKSGLKLLLVTRGNKGMALQEPAGAPAFIPISGSDDIVDVSGAGDTVTAVFGLSLMIGALPRQAAYLANLAAGQVVMKVGAVPVDPKELLRHWRAEVLQAGEGKS